MLIFLKVASSAFSEFRVFAFVALHLRSEGRKSPKIVLHMIPRKPLPIALGASLAVLLFVWVTANVPSTVSFTHKSQSYQETSTIDTDRNKVMTAQDLSQMLKEEISFTREVYQDFHDEYTKISYVNQKSVIEDERGRETTVLILSSIVDETAYGKGRNFDDFFNTIFSLSYPRNLASLGFLVGLAEEFQKVDLYFKKYFSPLSDLSTADKNHRKIIQKFVNRVTIVTAPFIEKEFVIDRDSRHNVDVQKQRRRTIARSRNFLVLNALNDERYTLFMDSDIIRIEHKNMINIFVESGQDIIVPRIEKEWDQDYDRNSWRGERTVPNAQQMDLMDKNDWQNFNFVPEDVNSNIYHLHHTLADTDAVTKELTYLVPLDAVGGAILFLKSIVYRQGVTFPTFYMIGTNWQRFEGYDGIETEGLCYAARTLGYKCWGYPNLVAEHSPGN